MNKDTFVKTLAKSSLRCDALGVTKMIDSSLQEPQTLCTCAVDWHPVLSAAFSSYTFSYWSAGWCATSLGLF